MAKSKLFDVNHQLTFYGAYHSHPINVAIHIVCVPMILWSAQVFLTTFPVPAFVPAVHQTINQYLTFELNWATAFTLTYWVYYFILEPVAAILYAPQLTVSVLSAISFAGRPEGIKYAAYVHVFSWIAQFIGHGAAEKRAPALLDNLLGAVVLAPFFVHLELLFSLGYNPDLHKRVQNGVGVEIAKFKKAEGDKRRAKEAASGKRD